MNRCFILILFARLADFSGQQQPLRAEEHPGLLGTRTASLAAGAWRFSGFDESSRSTAFSLNIPASWTDSLGTSLSHDIFVTGGVSNGFSYTKFVGVDSGYVYSTPFINGVDDDEDIIVDNVSESRPVYVVRGPIVRTVIRDREESTIYTAAVGTTVYVSSLNDFRPYLQVGYAYANRGSGNLRSVASSQYTGTRLPVGAQRFDLGVVQEEYEFPASHYVLLNPSFEYDIADVMSLRAQFDANVNDGLKHSSVSAGVTWWPQSSWFVNIGGRALIDGGGQGVSFSPGFRF